ncbi:hypothetical protein Bbelb_062190 [Branchiostoma belcheri]|nr:hypothetical protein Bbelb_062190 [Branchiostoma belcheri]
MTQHKEGLPAHEVSSPAGRPKAEFGCHGVRIPSSRAPPDGRRWYCMQHSTEDKPDRPAEMPEILTFVVGSRSWSLPSKLLAVRLSLHSRKEGSKRRRRLQDQMRFFFLPVKCNERTTKEASRTSQANIIVFNSTDILSVEVTACHVSQLHEHPDSRRWYCSAPGFWLNLNWKDELEWGLRGSFICTRRLLKEASFKKTT